MFSFDEGRKVAVIKGGARDGQYLYMRESKMGLKEVEDGQGRKAAASARPRHSRKGSRKCVQWGG